MGYLLAYQIFPLIAAWLIFMVMERQEWFRRWGMVLIFSGGALLQFALWWYSTPSLVNPDSFGFFLLSRGMEHDLRAILYRPKLYPLFLGLFPTLPAAVFAQCLLKLGCGLFLIRMSRILEWRPATTALVLFLYLLNSLWLQEPLQILDTTVFTCLFTACLWIAMETVVQPSLWRFAALCLAAATTSLERQVGDLSLAIVIGVAAWTMITTGKTKVGILLSMLLGAAIAMAGAVGNYVHHGVFTRSVALGVNLYTHATQYALADSHSQEWDFVEAILPGARAQTAGWNPHYTHPVSWPVNALPHRLERALGTGTKAEILAANKMLTNRSIRWARENPRAYAASIRNEATRLLVKCEEYYPQSLLRKVMPAPLWALRLERGIIHQPLWFLFGLGAMALIIGRGKRLPLGVLFLGPAAYVLLIAAIHIGFTRYALPILPGLLVLSGHAIDRVTGWISPPPA